LGGSHGTHRWCDSRRVPAGPYSDFEASGAFTPEEKAALRYAEAMARTPVEVSDAVFNELRRFYDERQIVELTSALAWENYRARFDHALGVEAEGFSEGAFCPLPVSEK
jgi:4-carboxymuconolactone decarboxylase